MAKSKNTVFFCQECGYESAKWMGQCPACKEWNTFAEEPAVPKSASAGQTGGKTSGRILKPVTLSKVEMAGRQRFSSGIGELDRVLGGGMIPGSLVLVGGDPGIGKSTLLLQVCRNVAADGKKVLYISGEESLQQIKIRAQRIGDFSESLLLLCETNLDDIAEVLKREKPEAAVIDSVQTMYSEAVSSAPGSVSQVRQATNLFLQLAKTLDITVFLVGHGT